MKKKLLIFHPTIAPYRVDFFNAICHAFETRICLQFKKFKGQNYDSARIETLFDFEPVYISESECSNIAIVFKAWRQIRDFNPDIILGCEFGAITVIALLSRFLFRKKQKIIVITDDSYDMLVSGNDFSLFHRIARKMIASHVDDFIVVEPQVEQWYQQRYGKGIYFPIIVNDISATNNYERLLPLSQQLAERHNLIGKKVLLSVSRLIELKNLHRVIDAFEQTKTDAVLVIVGDGEERDALEQHAKKKSKKILFMGSFDGDELYAWYNIATVFVLASYKEPFGAVTNEALLAGCRVVISQKAGSSCLVDETNGELIDPMSVDNIAKAIDHQFSIACVPDIKTPRKSLMNHTFEENIIRLIDTLNK